MTIAPVSQIAPLREVSTLIGAAIGGRLSGEQHLRSRLAAASIDLPKSTGCRRLLRTTTSSQSFNPPVPALPHLP